MPVKLDVRCSCEFIGSEYGGWTICPDTLSDSSVLYSFGVGDDISFDLGMIERFGLEVHAFDPTPRSVAWLKNQALPSQFKHYEIGLADQDGTATFVAPAENHMSFRMTDSSEGSVTAKVCRLETIARSLGHSRIDVLKMDIEGAEYDVIGALAGAPIEIQQLLVEFHHMVGQREELARTERAIAQLRALGFKLFANSAVGKEFSFISSR